MEGSTVYCKNWMFGIDNKIKITNKLNLIQKYSFLVGKRVVIAKGDSSTANHYWRN